MSKFNCIAAVCLLVLAGCSSLTKNGEKVKTWTGNPPKECKNLGDVSATGWANFPAKAKIAMKNDTAELGGNTLRIETVTTGTAFNCPKN